MPEIKITRKAWIIFFGFVSGIVLIGLALYFYSISDQPHITSPMGVKIIAVLLISVGIGAVAYVTREFYAPRYLIINSQGITNQFSFGLVTWDNIKSISRFEGTVGGGRYRSHVEGLKIEVRDKDIILRQISGIQSWNVGFAENRWGSVAIIYSSNWSWKLAKTEEAVQNYLTEYGNASKASKET